MSSRRPIFQPIYLYAGQPNSYVKPSLNINNCNNTLCYTYNHNNIYKPHSGYGQVGTSAAGYLATRKRL